MFSAYRMLKDFDNGQGFTVIQNAANSGVGRAVIQMAKALQIPSINIIREREQQSDTLKLIEELKQLGADFVITDKHLGSAEWRSWLSAYNKEQLNSPNGKPVRLALNCVGGRSATDIARSLVYVRSIAFDHYPSL